MKRLFIFCHGKCEKAVIHNLIEYHNSISKKKRIVYKILYPPHMDEGINIQINNLRSEKLEKYYDAIKDEYDSELDYNGIGYIFYIDTKEKGQDDKLERIFLDNREFKNYFLNNIKKYEIVGQSVINFKNDYFKTYFNESDIETCFGSTKKRKKNFTKFNRFIRSIIKELYEGKHDLIDTNINEFIEFLKNE